MTTVIEKASKTIGFLGLGLIVLGLLCIFVPQGVGMTVGVLIGVLLILAGVLRVTFAWLASSWGSSLLRVAFGLLAILAGGALIAQADVAPRVITMVAIAYLAIDGIAGIVFALRLPPAAGGASVLGGALVSLVLAAMLWREWPLPAERLLGIVIGLKLIVDGVVLMVIGRGGSKIDRALAGAERSAREEMGD